MKKIIFLCFVLFFLSQQTVEASCDGCKYCYGNADCTEIWGCMHSCCPNPNFNLCREEDCQGPNGSRCGQPAATPTPTRRPTPTVTPTRPPAPTSGPTATLRPTAPPLLPTVTPTSPPIFPPPAGVGGWFQTQEGDVHGNGDLIRAALPANQYFSLGSNLSAGVVSLNANLATFDLPVGQISLPGWQANGLDFKGASYSFYYRLFDSPTLADFAGFKPGDSQVHYSAGDVTFQGNWQISGGQKVLLLVDGNVEIPVEITVSAADQSFFFLAASGNISFTPPVKTAQGIFLADQTLSTGSGSELFEGQGVFYGRAVDLARPGSSSTQPAEKFLYRPDFWLSAPQELLLTSHTWQELAP
jgi:hypothetical protein